MGGYTPSSNQEREYNLHLHAVLGKGYHRGHLISAKVEVTNEIVLLKTEVKIKRKLEGSTGLERMFLEQSETTIPVKGMQI